MKEESQKWSWTPDQQKLYTEFLCEMERLEERHRAQQERRRTEMARDWERVGLERVCSVDYSDFNIPGWRR